VEGEKLLIIDSSKKSTYKLTNRIDVFQQNYEAAAHTVYSLRANGALSG